MLKSIAVAAALTLTAGIAAAQTIDRVVPVAGTGPGANASQWQSELTFHNVSVKPITAEITFHDSRGAVKTETIEIAPRATVSIEDVVGNTFGIEAGTGAIAIRTAESLRGKLVATSLTINRSANGDFGQDVPVLDGLSAVRKGDLGVIPGPSSALEARFNFGIFTAEPTTVEWKLVRSDGFVQSSVEKSYGTGVHVQYNGGVSSLFSATPNDNDVIHAQINQGSAWVYGSVVNQMTGDPSYVPGTRSRENFAPEMLGIDIDRDGVVDIFDADRDGVLDQTIDVATANFPSSFRLVAVDAEDDAISFEILSEVGATLMDEQGTVLFSPSASFKGTTGSLMVRVSDGRDHSDFTIPVLYR
jgi:hypothetical protein